MRHHKEEAESITTNHQRSGTSAAARRAIPHQAKELLSNTKPVTYSLKYLNSSVTARQHVSRLGIFFRFLELEGNNIDEQGLAFLNQVRRQSKKDGTQWAQEQIIEFIGSMKEKMHDNTTNERKRGELAAGTIKNRYHSIKLFYETFEDLPSINWKKLSRALPKTNKVSNDRAPTVEEIRKAIQAQHRRARSIILTMISSGIRLGAWDYLKWQHVTPIMNDKDEVIAAKLIVYNEEHDQYYCQTGHQNLFYLSYLSHPEMASTLSFPLQAQF
jgi:hypothetical protein